MTDLFKFLGVTVEKNFILGGGTTYPKTKYQVILDKVIPFAEGVEEERKRTDSGEMKSDKQNKETSSKSKNVSNNTPPSSSFGGSKKTKKRKFRKKKRKTKRKKSILKTRKKKKKKKKNKFTKRK